MMNQIYKGRGANYICWMLVKMAGNFLNPTEGGIKSKELLKAQSEEAHEP